MSDTTTKLTYLVGAKRLQEKNRDTEYLLSQEQLEMFEALVRADAQAEEREACAKFIEHDYVRQFERPWRVDLSAAIRARGNT